jgi:CheY-like chemotaxis protein
LERSLGVDVDIVLDIAPILPPVLVDRSQIEASLINLAINARDAMADGGTLTIKARSNGRSVDLTLSDTGPGMGPDVLAKATEPFFTTKPIGSGLGLGLAMVAAFAARSDGELILESPPGRGLDATIRLPTAVDVHGPSGARHDGSPVPIGHSEKVLLVEDDPEVLRTLCRQLEHLKYRVTCATSVEHAIETLAEDPAISVLVTDVGLAGGRSGIELVRQALKLRPDLGRLFVTANGVEAPDTNMPGATYLVKPVDLGTLARAVQAALQPRVPGSGAKT